mmetsp:Transcript_6279/g.10597  ORF Transcript_6279/g.10597 Transcript_6279/m.10597 type:complete len:220 (+) Transcript_6279:14-673(+)
MSSFLTVFVFDRAIKRRESATFGEGLLSYLLEKTTLGVSAYKSCKLCDWHGYLFTCSLPRLNLASTIKPHASDGRRNCAPVYTAVSPHSSSIRSSWLYFARRSERQGAPVLIWPVLRPTAKSAMKVSSVSPLRCDVITPQPAFLAIFTASMDSETEPIWLTFSSSALQAPESMAFCTRVGLVTSRSSPTIWHDLPSFSVIFPYESKSSWSKGSSIETIG